VCGQGLVAALGLVQRDGQEGKRAPVPGRERLGASGRLDGEEGLAGEDTVAGLFKEGLASFTPASRSTGSMPVTRVQKAARARGSMRSAWMRSSGLVLRGEGWVASLGAAGAAGAGAWAASAGAANRHRAVAASASLRHMTGTGSG
jgi:hypothetical protein